jgi:hypothetical protein
VYGFSSADPTIITSWFCDLRISCSTLILTFLLFKMRENNGIQQHIHPESCELKVIYVKNYPRSGYRTNLRHVSLKKAKESMSKDRKSTSVFPPLTLFWSYIYKSKMNLNSMWLWFAANVIVFACFCVTILIIKWNTIAWVIPLTITSNKEKSENSVFLPLWITPSFRFSLWQLKLSQ